MFRLVTLIVATAWTIVPARAADADVHALSVTPTTGQPTTDAAVVIHSSKRTPASPRPDCRLAALPSLASQTGGQYLVRRGQEGDSASMTLLHPLSTTTWVTPMALQLAQLDEDVIANDAVSIVLRLANDSVIELVRVGLEVDRDDTGVVRAKTHVRIPRQGIEELAKSPVVQVTWTLNGVDHISSLSRHQGQRWYQQPFTCLADSLT